MQRRLPTRRRIARAIGARVYLTFDDGPDPEWTPRVVEELARVGARATFFVIAERAAEHPDVVRALRAEGHEVGLHCMHHVSHLAATQDEIDRDVRDALGVLQGLGFRPRRWRPPGGALAPWTRRVARRHRLRLADWTADPRDWTGDLTGVMLARLAGELHPGATVVMHDGVGPGATRSDCSQTVELVEPLTGHIRMRGWHPGALDERRLPRRLVAGALREPGPPSTPAEVDVTLVPEADLTDAELAAVSRLLAESMTRLGPEYARRPWRRIRPEARALARVDGEIVGTMSLFRLRSRPPRRIYGLGDGAVRRDRRGQGIANRLNNALVADCWRRDAEVVLGDTVALRPSRMALGFAPVPRFRFHYERDGACRWHPNWLASIRHPEPRARLELEEGDF